MVSLTGGLMRVPRHLVDHRREQLRGLIRRDGFLPVTQICRWLGVSSPRPPPGDLSAIASNGQITRTYGGALADYSTSSSPRARAPAGPARRRTGSPPPQSPWFRSWAPSFSTRSDAIV